MDSSHARAGAGTASCIKRVMPCCLSWYHCQASLARCITRRKCGSVRSFWSCARYCASKPRSNARFYCRRKCASLRRWVYAVLRDMFTALHARIIFRFRRRAANNCSRHGNALCSDFDEPLDIITADVHMNIATSTVDASAFSGESSASTQVLDNFFPGNDCNGLVNRSHPSLDFRPPSRRHD